MAQHSKEFYKKHYQKYKKQQLAYKKINKERIKANNKKYYQELRNNIIKLLGNKCVRCGFNDKRALQIDHINGGGNIENKNTTKTLSLLFLNKIKNGSKEYQLLCANCNWIKRYENNEVRK